MKKIDDSAVSWFMRCGFIPYSRSANFDAKHTRLVIDDAFLNRCIKEASFFSNESEVENKKSYDFEEFDGSWRKCLSSSVPRNKKIGVLLSGGKDSSAIMYGLKREGFSNVTGYTYVPESGENESPDARALCEALGFLHRKVTSDFQKDFSAWIQAIPKSKVPSGDFAFPSVCRLFQEMKNEGVEYVLDGMGNDIYMGHVPPKSESFLRKLSLVKLFGRALWGKDGIASFMPTWWMKYIVSSITMHHLERMFPGSRLSISEIDSLGLPVAHIWDSLQYLEDKTKTFSEFDARAYVRGIFFDNFCAMEKSRIAGEAFGIEVGFPFADRDFSDYYTSLDEPNRFDKETRTNKIALRNYLKDLRKIYNVKIFSYNEKKGSFRFNFRAFLIDRKLELLEKIELGDDEVYHHMYLHLKKLLSGNLDYYDASKAYLIAAFLIWGSGQSGGGKDLI